MTIPIFTGIFAASEANERTSVAAPRLLKRASGGKGGGGYGGNKAVTGAIFRGNGNDSLSNTEASYLMAVAIGATVVFVLMLVGVILLNFYRQRIRRQQTGGIGGFEDDEATVNTDAEERDATFHQKQDSVDIRWHDTSIHRYNF